MTGRQFLTRVERREVAHALRMQSRKQAREAIDAGATFVASARIQGSGPTTAVA